jgi:5-methylthioadenosine/S-adenosylhomocysteine deaminase
MKRYFFANWLLPVSRPPIQDGFLATEEGILTEVGAIADLPENLQKTYNPEASPSFITPGLINTHTHLELSFGLTVPKMQQDTMAHWLQGVVEKVKEDPSAEAKTHRCLRGIEELLSTGTTCVNDISTDGSSAHVLSQKSMRGIVSLELIHPASESPFLEEFIQRYTALTKVFENHPFVKIGFSPHSPYNVSPEAWKKVIRSCAPEIIHTHLAESLDECRWLCGEPSALNELHQRFLNKVFLPSPLNKTPVAYLQHHELLNPKTIAAHSVYTYGEDRKNLAGAGVRIAHCPRSNQYLQGETLCWEDWEDYEYPIGLGTDSHLSCSNLDLREEARIAMNLHGWSAEEALKRLTIDGAKVLGLEDRIGSLDIGKSADFVEWNSVRPILKPVQFRDWLEPNTQVYTIHINGKSLCTFSRKR